MKDMQRSALFFALALTAPLVTITTPACAEDRLPETAEIQSSCSMQGGLYGVEEEIYCLNYFGVRLGRLTHSLMPSLCLACTLICDEEDLDYARCRERCARACGLENGGTSVVARVGSSPLALTGSR
ncbi:hypothetical protein dsat_0496 [Alkalidesulfovibrio alkalitolerans DSM 16529]|uniref:Uncharacterized protein n=1 Tax=Alkalidesulfovibrio alkalitolerans DSM 16529 TaxID=1121439 RepID=S7T942_9BACT|nr:hypothetical protein dsat_0496 [Alkalidesulfovibrio alkalitolerans DSM 16529]